MQKRSLSIVAAVAVMASQAACYNTRVVSGRVPAGPEYTDRQWFTVAGLANLSGPAGRECPNGLASVESRMSATDWLINAGLGVAGGIAGSLACGGADAEARAYCASAGAALVPFLLSSRTVEYICVPDGSTAERPAWMPPATGNVAPVAASAQ
ncbi:hypothetical protein JQX13_15910 [Archangium violaceum]|uniref:hypothetical protein n=1 Tax=Archangium violaceum TaxID=83451 RepID=UPI00193C652F|nr:hypothetical protein [Archangium violaceum]QRK11423.1 hypothetical protein JQX13_15910 [Archangium violaceum]